LPVHLGEVGRPVLNEKKDLRKGKNPREGEGILEYQQKIRVQNAVLHEESIRRGSMSIARKSLGQLLAQTDQFSRTSRRWQQEPWAGKGGEHRKKTRMRSAGGEKEIA